MTGPRAGISKSLGQGALALVLALALGLGMAAPVLAQDSTATTGTQTETAPADPAKRDGATADGAAADAGTADAAGQGGDKTPAAQGTAVVADQSGAIQRGGAANVSEDEPGVSLKAAASLPTIGKSKPGTDGGLDFAAWEEFATNAETLLSQPDSLDSQGLDRLRRQIATWRQAFLGAENANLAKIDTLKQQIAALGPAPAQGVTEPDEIAKRRLELADQMTRLQAPGLAADEAYRRADGLISEIDQIERDRQADELMKLWPSPLNPANWPMAAEVFGKPASIIWGEIALRLQSPVAVRTLVHNLPLITFYLVVALALVLRGRAWLARALRLVKGPTTIRARRIWDFFVSIAVAMVPVAGLVMLSLALEKTGMLGPAGLTVLGSLGRLGFIAVAGYWIGQRAFPASGESVLPVNLTPERMAEARWLAMIFGVLLMLARFRRLLLSGMDLNDAAVAVAIFPVMVIAGYLLWRMGRVLATHDRGKPVHGEDIAEYRHTAIRIIAQATKAIGIIGPVLAGIGYVGAAQALLLPAAMTLALLAFLYILHDLFTDVWALVTNSDGKDEDGLVPVLAGFALALGALPAFALIWGARVSELTELWARFQAGFTLGQARISPTDFLIFAVIFGAGYALTRMVKGLMRSTVMPRTSLDPGGQNAIVSGLGYVGIFLSALVAFNATGIDLSGLAVVAGALSVGIGFGLQQVVSNFISGLILLIERPVSEGDWIEVGPVQGIVKTISVRSTRIQTFDRSDVIVPNTDLITGRVTNWTRFSLAGRLVVPVSVPFTVDSRKVAAILREIAEAQPLVLMSPPPVVALTGFGAELMNFEIRVILRDVNFQVEVRSEINHAIAARFAEAGIPLSAAHRDWLAKQAEGPAAEAAAAGEQRAQDELLAALMGEAVARRVRAAREGEPPADAVERPAS